MTPLTTKHNGNTAKWMTHVRQGHWSWEALSLQLASPGAAEGSPVWGGTAGWGAPSSSEHVGASHHCLSTVFRLTAADPARLHGDPRRAEERSDIGCDEVGQPCSKEFSSVRPASPGAQTTGAMGAGCCRAAFLPEGTGAHGDSPASRCCWFGAWPFCGKGDESSIKPALSLSLDKKQQGDMGPCSAACSSGPAQGNVP